MGENKGMLDDWFENFKSDCSGFADLAQFIEDRESQAEDYIAAEAENNRMHNDAMESILKNSRYLQELSKIAEAAQKQAELAEKQAKAAQAEAENAQKEAKAARRQGAIANVTAVVSAIIAAASWLIPRELIAAWVSELLK